jgi:hypothetical protein
MQRMILGACLLVWFSAAAPPSSFAVTIEDQVIGDSTPVANERFGTDVAAANTTQGTWTVVGAPGDNGFAGSAFMWALTSAPTNTWVPLGELTADSPAPSAQFGKVVAISEDVVVVGSPFWATQGHGAAYVFRLTDVGGGGSAWTFEQRLTPTLAESQSNAGWSVSVSGDVIVVGTFYSLVSKAYVYRFDGDSWVKEKELPLTGTGAITVAVSGDVIAVEYQTLEIYRYTGSDWVKEDDFGSAISFDLEGDDLLIGDSVDDVLAENAGAATFYHYDGMDWVEGETLRASDGEAGDKFGSKVDLTEGRALIFASEDQAGVGSGYVFDRQGSSWTEIEKLVSSDSILTDMLGSGIAVTDRAALIGAPNFTDTTTQEGLTYTYLLPVPEPSATLLGFAALASVVALVRRRRSCSQLP